MSEKQILTAVAQKSSRTGTKYHEDHKKERPKPNSGAAKRTH
jgi:hypothetical protein